VTDRAEVVVVGGGHNGLVAACYLARAGRDVVVLEQSDRPGGGARTDETIPGYRFDTHSVAHNILNMTSIPAELDLAGAGLHYTEMAPFAAGFFPDGRVVRFSRSVEETCASIAEHDPAEAARYRRLMERALPLVDVAVAGLESGSTGAGVVGAALSRVRSLVRAIRRNDGVTTLARSLLQPYGSLLTEHLGSDLTRAPITSFAAHSSVGPDAAGGSFFAIWQAAYHRFGQWHASGGSGGLTTALVARLESFGGRVECGADVRRIDAGGGRVRGVETADGRRVEAPVVLTATQPQYALLELLDPPLAGRAGAALRAVHVGNAVQCVLHVATSALPPYRNAQDGDWNGLQSHAESMAEVGAGFRAAEARRLPDPPTTYAFTTSALDDTLAPPGRHTVYLACPSAPFALDGATWEDAGPAFTEAMLDSVELVAPGFRDTVLATHLRTPAEMARELRWPGAHPMHVDITLDQLALLRPTKGLAGHRTPVPGLFLTGAGTAPVGGIAGAPGKAAAQAVLSDR
jgi:phytoene dehydrogenase-like protein